MAVYQPVTTNTASNLSLECWLFNLSKFMEKRKMNRSKFIDYLLEKGECNRFNEHQIDAIEQFCFALYENTELDKSVDRIVELESERNKMISCMSDISNACIGQLSMSYSLDAEDIGQSIYAATGMTNPQMNAYLKEIVSLKP
jgi:hypothetical protein